MKGFQRRYLRGAAHGLKPVVIIGQKGCTDKLLAAINEALNTHELIKIRFIELKEKTRKNEMLDRIQEKTACENVGMIGHTAILYRQHKDPEKRKIKLMNS